METEKTVLPILPNGIEKIALSFSGGGFRAAAFTLGCTAYLYHLHYLEEPLLHKVKFISSASGGSMTNLVLSSMLREGYTFPEIYDFQREQLSGCLLMDEVFRLLGSSAAWNQCPDKTKNLINAFALAYDSLLFKGATFKALHQTPKKEGFVIAETCINTTEFDNGMNFRWGTSGDLGNKYLHFQPKRLAADKIKLGDIMASSSCFPGGFEPIMFPRDFTYKGKGESLTATELNTDIIEKNYYNGKETNASKANQEITFGFMDGGIDDNQGIYAFQLADERKAGRYDLYFPCDVSSNFLDSPFQYPKELTQTSLKQTLPQVQKKLKIGIKIYFAAFLILLLFAIGCLFFELLRPLGLVLLGAGVVGIALPALGYWLGKKWFYKTIGSFFPSSGSNSSWGLIFDKYKGDLLKIPLNSLITMLLARASSVLLLAMDVYLKRIRQISYKLLYTDKANNVNEQIIAGTVQKAEATGLWKEHIGVTTVYQLSTKNDFMLKQILEQDHIKDKQVSDEDTSSLYDLLYPIPAEIRQAADLAANVATTLWFDVDQQKAKAMENLIVTGQVTMCYNLILMAFQFGNTDIGWLDLKADLLKDWKAFKENSFFLYDKIK